MSTVSSEALKENPIAGSKNTVVEPIQVKYIPHKEAVASEAGTSEAGTSKVTAIPDYLQKLYWWAYVHPKAVHYFEREWLINLILLGNYGRLRDAALADLGRTVSGKTLQVACVYGNLTPQLRRRLAPEARLDVVDVLPIQLQNLGHKMPSDTRVALIQGDSSALAFASASYDQVLLFFLLHEQPEAVRRATLAEALRVLKPGGKLVIVDYHRPSAWHPLRLFMRAVFRTLEPYAMDLWNHDISAFMPTHLAFKSMQKKTYAGGLYQKLVILR